MKLVPDDDGATVEEEPSEPFMHGTWTRTTEDGEEQSAEFFLDEETGVLTRIGGEELAPDDDAFELLNMIANLPPPAEITAEWMLREHGEEKLRTLIESQREMHGDETTDQMLAETDAAVVSIEIEDARGQMEPAFEALDAAITSARNIDTDPPTVGGAGETDVVTALLDAAEHARECWVRLDKALST
jgi:hypothetical protein